MTKIDKKKISLWRCRVTIVSAAEDCHSHKQRSGLTGRRRLAPGLLVSNEALEGRELGEGGKGVFLCLSRDYFCSLQKRARLLNRTVNAF